MPDLGYVYAVEFKKKWTRYKLVKVGRGLDAEERIKIHRRNAGVFGWKECDRWISKPHYRYENTEGSMITFCDERWPREGTSREWFRGADLERIKGAADWPIQWSTLLFYNVYPEAVYLPLTHEHWPEFARTRR